MKKALITFSSLAIVFIFINASLFPQLPCDSPQVGGHTGAPGETGCDGCHAGVLNSGPAQVNFDLGITSYVAGQTYTGTVRISQAGMQKFGYSALALKNSDNSTVGSFSLMESVRTRTYSDGPRNYVSHTPCGADSTNANSWKFKWTAPSFDAGKVTLYLGLLAADHSHSTSGDYSYSDSIVLASSILNSIDDGSLALKPKITYDGHQNLITIKEVSNTKITGVTISDMSGNILLNSNFQAYEYHIPTYGCKPGLYLLRLRQGAQHFNTKIFIPTCNF